MHKQRKTDIKACRKHQYNFVAIGKARATYAQTFTLWQQPTIEFTRQDHSRRHRYQAQSTVHLVHKHY